MQQTYILGIDIGTGSTKGVAVTPSGTILATAQEYYQAQPGTSVFSEQDPEQIWQAFVQTVQSITRTLQEPPVAISLSSCMHSLVLMDAANKPLTPNITWADRRSAAIAEQLRTTPEGEALYKATGTPLHAMSPLCKLRWFNQHQHGLFKKLGKAISIKEYIWFNMFGVYEIDHSIASATGLFDVLQLQWFAPALEFCGITPNQLSTPVPTTYIRTDLPPSVATLLQVPPGTPVCIGASDGCLANVGSNALEAGTAAVTIGTSGAVRIASKQPVVVFPDMIFNYRLDAATFICGGAINNGGNVVQWLLQQFLGQATSGAAAYVQLFERAAAVPAGSDGLLCLPYLTGERTPLWDEKTCGVYFGFHAQHGTAHFIRAALEGVCFALQGIIKKLEEATGVIQTLQVSGGMVHSDMWMQLLADVTGKNVSLLFSEDASAVGAARLCFKAMGITKSYAVAGETIQKEMIPNQQHHAVYKTSFHLFQSLYAALKPAMHQLYNAAG